MSRPFVGFPLPKETRQALAHCPDHNKMETSDHLFSSPHSRQGDLMFSQETQLKWGEPNRNLGILARANEFIQAVASREMKGNLLSSIYMCFFVGRIQTINLPITIYIFIIVPLSIYISWKKLPKSIAVSLVCFWLPTLHEPVIAIVVVQSSIPPVPFRGVGYASSVQ